MSNSKRGLHLVLVLNPPIELSVDAMAEQYKNVYKPIFELFERYENIKISLSLGGFLADYLVRHHEKFFLKIKNHAQHQRINMLAQLFYGASPRMISDIDVYGQIRMNKEFWESFLGQSPSGFWCDSKFIDSSLIQTISDSDLNYCIVEQDRIQCFDRQSTGTLWALHQNKKITCFIDDGLLKQGLPHQLDLFDKSLDELYAYRNLVTCVWKVPNNYKNITHIHQQWEKLLTYFNQHESIKMYVPEEYLNDYPVVDYGSMIASHQHHERPIWSNTQDRMMYEYVHKISENLHEQIEKMHDQNLERTWSSELATAQRHIFSAQGALSSIVDQDEKRALVFQDAVLEKCLRSDRILKTLEHGQDGWMICEDYDLFTQNKSYQIVSNPMQSVWVNTSAGGRIDFWNAHHLNKNILNFPKISTIYDVFSTNLPDLNQHEQKHIKIIPKNLKFLGEIKEEQANEYVFCAQSILQPNTIQEKSWVLQKEIVIPFESSEIHIDYFFDGHADSIFMQTSIPVRLGVEPHQLFIDKKHVQSKTDMIYQAQQLRIENERMGCFDLDLSPNWSVQCIALEKFIGETTDLEHVSGFMLILTAKIQKNTELNLRFRVA